MKGMPARPTLHIIILGVFELGVFSWTVERHVVRVRRVKVFLLLLVPGRLRLPRAAVHLLRRRSTGGCRLVPSRCRFQWADRLVVRVQSSRIDALRCAWRQPARQIDSGRD